MNTDEFNRLIQILKSRQNKLEYIKRFDISFFDFSRNLLERNVEEVNIQLMKFTSDRIKIFYDDPYEARKIKYYVLLQLFSSTKNEWLFLDNSKINPSLKFEGIEFSGKVKISIKLQDEERFMELEQVEIQKLNEEKISKILVQFIDKVYSN